MKRRDFLRTVGLLGIGAGLPSFVRPLYAASPSPYTGTIFINIHAAGGLDQSFFADPRENPSINTWAQTESAGQAGNIRYAPVLGNQAFFEKYYQDMLVINGIDGQTNAHETGTRVRWSGRLARGYPNTAELIAGVLGQGLPMAYLFGGGYGRNVGIMPYTRLIDPTLLTQIATPNRNSGSKDWLKAGDLDKIQRYKRERLTALMENPNVPDMARALSEFDSAYQGRELLDRLGAAVPSSIDDTDSNGEKNALVRHAHLALVCASAGLTASVNLLSGGFDTHDNHDVRHGARLRLLTAGIDYLWEKAAELGLADRMVVFVTSELSRTPRYNVDAGKDHWPIGSAMFMQKNAAWGNRVVGASDEGHKALKINPDTLAALAVDDEQGVILTPKHVMQAYRQLAGIDTHPLAEAYPLGAEKIDIFDNSKETGYVATFS